MKLLVFPWIALLEKFYPPTTIPDTQELETGHAAHADFSVKPVCSSVDLQITDETSTLTLFSEDPANWDRENENLIEHLILNPPEEEEEEEEEEQFELNLPF
ncbi:hypothetical protein OUZ56_032096 [Daphnia magna]|uniref:Uncharacterized protein n=1 Tax=Daphnia magna TaxID=35525 RepID=A0ABQ9ZW71_9CRUS|nr:hypothetical protein OUZ56_032096 [Daphnia magna]